MSFSANLTQRDSPAVSLAKNTLTRRCAAIALTVVASHICYAREDRSQGVIAAIKALHFGLHDLLYYPAWPTTSDMFTVEQINELHARLGSARTFPEYVLALKELGVERYDILRSRRPLGVLRAGRPQVVSSPEHEVLPIAES